MVAPIDAKVTFEAEGETFTLRLNFRSLALSAANGVDLLAGKERSPLDMAVALRALAVADHPEMTDDEALSLVLLHSVATGEALVTLFSQFSGAVEAGAKGRPGKSRAKAA